MVAKTRQIQIDIEIKRKTRISIDDVLVAHNELFKNTVGNLKAYRNKILTQDLFNEIMADWRAVAKDTRDQSDLANGQTAADRPPGLPWPVRPSAYVNDRPLFLLEMPKRALRSTSRMSVRPPRDFRRSAKIRIGSKRS